MSKPNNIQRTGVVITLIAAVAFLYVWQKVQVLRLGYKIRTCEKQIEQVKEDNSLLQLDVSTLLSPQNIKREVDRLGLGLRPPEEKQIVRVKK